MNWLPMSDKELKSTLRAIPRVPRTALAAACAERVHEVWEKHWVGDYSPSVKEAIEAGWAYAINPGVIPPGRESLLDDLRDVADYLGQEDIEVLCSTVTVAQRVMESITDDDAASALALERALGSALFVAKLAGDISGYGEDKAQEEELGWQNAALELVQTWNQPCRRDMFDGVGPKPPAWWKAYEAGNEYY